MHLTLLLLCATGVEGDDDKLKSFVLTQGAAQ